MLITLTIITFVLVLFIIWAVIEDCDDAIGIGVGLLAGVGLVGWVFLGNVVPLKAVTTEMTAIVLHDKNACHLSVDDAVVATYNDVATVNFLTERETVKVIRTQSYNMYGGRPSTLTPTWAISNKQ